MYKCSLSGQFRKQIDVDTWGYPHWRDLIDFDAPHLDAALERAENEGWWLIGRRETTAGGTTFQLENCCSDEGELICEDLEA